MKSISIRNLRGNPIDSPVFPTPVQGQEVDFEIGTLIDNQFVKALHISSFPDRPGYVGFGGINKPEAPLHSTNAIIGGELRVGGEIFLSNRNLKAQLSTFERRIKNLEDTLSENLSDPVERFLISKVEKLSGADTANLIVKYRGQKVFQYQELSLSDDVPDMDAIINFDDAAWIVSFENLPDKDLLQEKEQRGSRVYAECNFTFEYQDFVTLKTINQRQSLPFEIDTSGNVFLLVLPDNAETLSSFKNWKIKSFFIRTIYNTSENGN